MKRLTAGAILALAFLAVPTAARANGPVGFNIGLNFGMTFSACGPCGGCGSGGPPCYGFGPCFAPAYCGLGMAPPSPVYYDAASGMALPYPNPAANYGAAYGYGTPPSGNPPPTPTPPGQAPMPPKTAMPVGFYPQPGYGYSVPAYWYGR
jgi:hypothetical protein